MASIHRRPKSPYWHAAYTLPDGRRTLRSTGTTNGKKAMTMALEFEKASNLGRQGLLTDQKAREAIASIYSIANQDLMPASTVAEYIDHWLRVKEIETKERTMTEYRNITSKLMDFLGPKSKRPMDAITVKDALCFRDTVSNKLSPASANKYLKIIRVVWNDAIRDSMVGDNPFRKVKSLGSIKGNRKAFTVAQLKMLLAKATESWRGMILLGFYIGQRLGDLSRLTWQNIDLENEQIILVTQKTDRAMTIPMARPLVDFFTNMSAPDEPTAYVFPDLARVETVTLSGQFSTLVADCGLGTYSKKRKDDGKGRATKRSSGNLSFHCLRHTATVSADGQSVPAWVESKCTTLHEG